MNNRKILISSIAVLSVGLVASIGLLVAVLPENVALAPNSQAQTDVSTEVESPTEAQPEETVVDSEDVIPEVSSQVSSDEAPLSPQIGMTTAALTQLSGTPQTIREAEAAYIYEYQTRTYVVDEQQQQVIGYWVYAGQTSPITGIEIDWEQGFAQAHSTITWHGPYQNLTRGSAYVLHGYTQVDGVNYVLEYGADDEAGYGNQVVAIYEQ